MACGALFASGCQPADNQAPKVQQKVQQDDTQEERLWLTPPEGWELTSNQITQSGLNGSAVRHVRYVDPQESTHSLTVESRQNSSLGQPAADPLDLLEHLAQNEQQNCNKAEDFNTFTGFEDGYGTAVRLFVCEPTDLTAGRLTLLKIIQGQQQTYLVALQHQWTNAPSSNTRESLATIANSNNIFDRVAVWSLYMRSVRVCAASGCQQRDL